MKPLSTYWLQSILYNCYFNTSIGNSFASEVKSQKEMDLIERVAEMKGEKGRRGRKKKKQRDKERKKEIKKNERSEGINSIGPCC